ncbi:peptidase M23 [Clostridia bacterium]|nr:peptidase M23 [Clostridia bacterium]
MKKIIALLLCLSLTFGSSTLGNVPVNTAEVDISKEQERIAEIDKQIKENKVKIEKYRLDLETKKNDIQAEIDDLTDLQEKIFLQNDNIVKVQEEIDLFDAGIAVKEEEIIILNFAIAQQETDILDEIEAFKRRLVAMYVTKNSEMTEILVGTSDFIDILARIQILESVSKTDKKMIINLNNHLNSLNENRQSLENAKIDLEIKKANTQRKKEEHVVMLEELNADLDDVNGRIYSLRKEGQNIDLKISGLYEENENYEAEEKQIEEDIKRKQAEAAKKNALKDIDPSLIYSGGLLAWPVPASYMVTSGFGPRWGKMHTGIDVAAPYGTPIVAAETGVVIIANVGGWGGGYGTYVVVSHNSSLATLYGHMSSVNCYEGQVVTRGDVIGYVGSTGDSTGNHLHFEVRVNGSRQDPTNYL